MSAALHQVAAFRRRRGFTPEDAQALALEFSRLYTLSESTSEQIRNLTRERDQLRQRVAVLEAQINIGKDDVLTSKEVATILGTTVGTLAKWRVKGRGPDYEKIGRSVRYRRGAVMVYRERQAVKGGDARKQ